MHPLDFHTTLSLGTAIAALITLLCLLLTPTLGGSRTTRLLAVGNLCFTMMLAGRLSMDVTPPNLGYAAIWTLLIVTAALFAAAAAELIDGPPRPSWPRHVGLVVALLALWIALAASPTAQWGAVVTGLATLLFYAVSTHSALSMAGRSLTLPRRTLAATFGLGGVFAMVHVIQRVADLSRGVDIVPATAVTYFGAILLFCATNLGFLLRMYLKAAEQVGLLAQTDELTGALNRRGFGERLDRLRAGGTVPGGALVLIDIDRFKAVNDTHGHAVGDEVLRWFAATLRRFMRHDDLLMRMGGEEFCLLLPGVDAAQGMRVAERIREEFEAHCTAPTSVGPLRITASFGLAAYGADDDPRLEARLRQADEALYAAKRGGRNRVVRWSPAPQVGAPA